MEIPPFMKPEVLPWRTTHINLVALEIFLQVI